MFDPLSVLGVALGVTSLIIQVTDECVKGYKYYSDAIRMHKDYRHLHVRLQIETQRFLHFGLEAGILYSDFQICTTLQINRSLLLAVLAEVKDLLHQYSAKKGKYEDILSTGTDTLINEDGKTDIIPSLLIHAEELESDEVTSTNMQSIKHPFKSVRKLRKIIAEPRCLVWAAFDKGSFESLLSKLENLNSFLIALLDGSQIKRLQEAMNTSYLEILQIRNDIKSLKGLVEALSPSQQKSTFADFHLQEEINPLSQAIADQVESLEKTKKYLKRLAEIKIQHARLEELGRDTPISSSAPELQFEDFYFSRMTIDEDESRTNCKYKDINVWVEWKETPTWTSLEHQKTIIHIENRIRLLTDLLCEQKPDGFRAAPCLGYLKVLNNEEEPRFGLVFMKPSGTNATSTIISLRELLQRRFKPSLSTRMDLCAALGKCISSFHTVNWMHKGMRSDNIIFFSSKGPMPDLTSPYVSGFELSRPIGFGEMTEKPNFDPTHDIYRHPHAQSSCTSATYRKSYDLYSLGIVLLEIEFWKPIEYIVGLERLDTAKPSMLREMKNWLLGKECKLNEIAMPDAFEGGSFMQQVAAEGGDAFQEIVEACLTSDGLEKLGGGETDTIISGRLQRAMDEHIVKRLELLAEAMRTIERKEKDDKGHGYI